MALSVLRFVRRMTALLSGAPSVSAAAVSGACLLASWAWDLAVDPAWAAVLLCGAPIFWSGLTGLLREKRIGSDLLVSIAMAASVGIGELFAAGEVAFIMAVGMLLEERTLRKATSAVTDLIDLVPREARLLRDAEEKVVPVAEVREGDLLLVRPGEVIPVDGVVTAGRSSVDQAALTGESLPSDKKPGDPVYGGSLNQFGALAVRATGVGAETTLARVARLVVQAQMQKAPVERLADRWAARVVPASLALAIAVWLWTGDPVRAVTILIVFCPCALVLGTPTAVAAGIGAAARRGILIKSGAALEAAGRVHVVLLDKTGTLTHGSLQVVDLFPAGAGRTELLAAAGGAERYSEHPLGRAIVARARAEGVALPEPEEFAALVGQGVRAVVGGQTVLVGNRALLEEAGVAVPAAIAGWMADQEGAGRTVVLVAADGQVLGAVAMADTVRRGARELVEALRRQGFGVGMLTGDTPRVAAAIAGEVGIEYVGAGLMPEMKHRGVACLSGHGFRVSMVGDGINDAPALARADLGIAMGRGGTQIAAESADITLLSDDLRRVPELLALGRRTLAVIRQNIIGATLLNGAAVLMAALGMLGPVPAALVHNLGSVLVVLNSARLLRAPGHSP